jgi:hypothetical protein
MSWHKAILLLSVFLAGPSSATEPAKSTIWLGVSFETLSFAKEVNRVELAKALALHSKSVVTAERALEAAQWYAEEVLPKTSRERIADGPTWKRASVEKVSFAGAATAAFVIELIPPIPEGGLEGLPGVARLLVAGDGSVLDVTSKRAEISFRTPVRIPAGVWRAQATTSTGDRSDAKP